MRFIARTIRWLLVGGTWLYCLGICGLAILWSEAHEQIWWVDFTNIFAALFFIPLILLIPLMIFIHSWSFRSAVVVPTIVFLLLFGSYFVPKVGAKEQPNLRVVTLNHLYTNTQPATVIAEIQAQKADLVALQELSPAVATLLEQQLKSEFPYQWLKPSDDAGGIGLISRHPLEHAEYLLNSRAQKAIVVVNGQRLTVINVHLHFSGLAAGRSAKLGGLPMIRDYDTTSRTLQVRALIAEILDERGPLIVMGDFNQGDREPGYTEMASMLTDSYRATASGFGFTFPNQKHIGPLTIPFPLVRIDYIWVGGGITPDATRTNCNPIGADHCMVIADLHLNT